MVALIVLRGAGVEYRLGNRRDASLMACIALAVLVGTAGLSQITLPLDG